MSSALLVVTGLLTALGAPPQDRVSLSGTVLDATGRGVPKVEIVGRHLETGKRSKVKTDRAGRFEFKKLQPGQYELEANALGFRELRDTVEVTADVKRDLNLQIGPLYERVTVHPSRRSSQPASLPAKRSDEPLPARECKATADGGKFLVPIKVMDVRPEYPAALADSGVGGSFTVHGRVGIDGNVHDLVIKESVHGELAASAIGAIRGWRFSPVLLNCVPFEQELTVDLIFQPAR